MNARMRSGGSDAPGVWDAASSAEVTEDLCAAARRLWRSDVPPSVAQASARSLSNLLGWADIGRTAPTTSELMTVYGHAGSIDPQRLAERDVVAAAAATGFAAAVGGELTDVSMALVTFAALDATARASRSDGAEVLRAHAVAISLFQPLQGIFDDLQLEPARTRTTVATIVAGLAAGLLRSGPDGDLAHTVGLLSSCSTATGPVPSEGASLALVLGKAAANAVLAGSLIERGFTANARALEGSRGLLRALSGESPAEGATQEFEALSYDPGALTPVRSEDEVGSARYVAPLLQGLAWTEIVDQPTTEVRT